MVKKDYWKMYLGAAIILFVFMMLLAGGIGYYQFEPFFRALNLTLTQDFPRLQFHFGWTEYYRHCYIGATLIYFCIIAWMSVEFEKYRRDAAGVEAGSSKWNDNLKKFSKKYAAPFKQASNASSENMILSQNVRLHINDMKTHKNNNFLVVGPAGKGKTRFLIKPNILQGNCSFVVTDPSGELLDTLGVEMRELGYEVKVFNLVDMAYSNQYNPFHYINEPKDVGVVVDCFLRNTTPPEESSSDPFWEKSETALLTAIIFFLKDFADEDCRNFRTVLQMVQYMELEENATKEQKTKLDALFEGEAILVHGKYQKLTNAEERKKRKGKLADSLALKNYHTFKLGGAKTLKSVLMSAAVRLNPFLIPEIINLTETDTLEMDTVGNKKTIVFIIIPQANTTYNFLASMLFAQTFEALYFKAGKREDGTTDDSNLRYKYHIRFLMDEYANIGNIPDFPKKISTMRKYNMSATVILQSISQIKQMHKDDYETVISNCDTIILLGANDITTAEYFIKLMGKGTIRVRSTSLSEGKKKSSSMNFQQTGRELMMIDEIRGMPFEKCIVLVNGEKPFYDDKFDLEQHELYEKTGDADSKRKFNLLSTTEFLNTDFKEYVEMELQPKESPDAENVISKPADAGRMDIAPAEGKTGSEARFDSISDPDRADAIKYIARMKSLADKAFSDENKRNIQIPCPYLGAADPRLIPALVVRYSREWDKPVIAFCNEISSQSYIRGYFLDRDGLIFNILTKNGYEDIEPLASEDKEDTKELFCLKRVTQQDYLTIRESMHKGVSVEDDIGKDEVEDMYRTLGF